MYIPEDRPTLILVDDPSGQLGDPGLANMIAGQIGHQLVKEEVIGLANVVSPHKLYDLAAEMGSEYVRTPVDQIGQRLGARQVIYVYIQSVSLSEQPGLFRPTAVVRVKLIDVTEGRQLFPEVPGDLGSSETEFHNIHVVMYYRGAEDFGHGVVQTIRKKLADRISRDVSRLFFEYLPRQPGDKFDD